MCYSGSHSAGLEYLVGNSYSGMHSRATYFSRNLDDNYSFEHGTVVSDDTPRYGRTAMVRYNEQKYFSSYAEHFFTPEMLLNPSRPSFRFIDDNNEAEKITEEIFELMTGKKMPDIKMSILPLDDFRKIHSRFGPWSNGILGFSLNKEKKIFIREDRLDAVMLVIGHEIGHVVTGSLPNRHDEEAKAFSFSVEWAKTIKKHNVASLGASIRDGLDFEPARNGLHDIAFSFVNLMLKKGWKPMQLHDDLARRYVSIFNAFY